MLYDTKSSLDISQRAAKTAIHELATSSFGAIDRSTVSYADAISKSADTSRALQQHSQNLNSGEVEPISMGHPSSTVESPRSQHSDLSLDAEPCRRNDGKERRNGGLHADRGSIETEKAQIPAVDPSRSSSPAASAQPLQRTLSR